MIDCKPVAEYSVLLCKIFTNLAFGQKCRANTTEVLLCTDIAYHLCGRFVLVVVMDVFWCSCEAFSLHRT